MIEIKNLSVKYKSFFALKNINLKFENGEKVGVVGQSGSGKTTLCRVIAGIEKNFIGEVNWVDSKSRIQFIFQDPSSSLNPRMKVFDIVTEPLFINNIKDKNQAKNMFDGVMKEVGLVPEVGNKYPHELSGGQRQRVSIARAIIIKPDVLICDEPISSLDISLAAQILNLIDNIYKRHKFTLIFVSHDISSVYYLTDRIVVLLNGHIVEEGVTEKIIENPLHPYTKLLISSILYIGKKSTSNLKIDKKILDSACPFASQCFYISDICKDYSDVFFSIDNKQRVKCLRYKELIDEKIYS
ncbi:MAG: ATP-binding cassette domain-containing protein [Elusimicrobiales bacterium]|nr:ATP-binding cassette domain-containing protein [Elusimicrobiales bacterium]